VEEIGHAARLELGDQPIGSRQAPAQGERRSIVSDVFRVIVRYAGQDVEDVVRCPTRRVAAHAAAELAASPRADGQRPVMIDIVVDSELGAPERPPPALAADQSGV
jgi:hypothetical protein